MTISRLTIQVPDAKILPLFRSIFNRFPVMISRHAANLPDQLFSVAAGRADPSSLHVGVPVQRIIVRLG
jgi:hypothetical protein